MLGKQHILIDFYPKYPNKWDFVIDVLSEMDEKSYCDTTKMKLEFRLNLKLKNSERKTYWIDRLMVSCNNVFGIPVSAEIIKKAKEEFYNKYHEAI